MRNKVSKVFTANFDEKNPNWSNTPEYNAIFLRAQKNYMNDLLRMGREFMTLNDVFDQLSIPRTNEGMVYGWRGDDVIEFGIEIEDILDAEDGFQLTFNTTKIYEEN